MSQKILIANIAYPPEIRSIAVMARELAEDLSERGYAVTVLTAHPQQNLIAGEGARRRHKDLEIENGIKIIRVPLPNFHRIGFASRGLITLMLDKIFLLKLRKHSRDIFDAAFIYSPPLTVSGIGSRLKEKYGTKFILNIQDIFPQNAIDLGALCNPFLIKLFEYIEKRAYAAADIVTAHTPGSREFLIKKKGVAENKMRLISNWIDIEAHRRAKPTGKYRKQYALEGKFVFLFAGIFGPAQDIGMIVNVAKALKNIPDIHFLMLGEGMQKAHVAKEAQEAGLENMTFGDFVPEKEYPALVKEMDMGLACLSPRNQTAVVPGKIIGFMACKVPVLAFLNNNSDGHRLLAEAACGFAARSDDLAAMIALTKEVYQRRAELAEIGARGFAYVDKNFSKKYCIDQLAQLI